MHTYINIVNKNAVIIPLAQLSHLDLDQITVADSNL
jgi:hypothetical protein